MRIGVVDIGTNSTRLLVADVEHGHLARELERDTTVTRLGEGVDRDGRLREEAMQRVLAVCERYRETVARLAPARAVAILTSAVRDASNGPELERALARLGFDAHTISGEQEARLTYRGATSWREHERPLLVLDIGGGSTELVVGAGEEVHFHVSTQVGSVRFTERYLRSDPASPEDLRALREQVRAELEGAVPDDVRRMPEDGVAVAGTPTSFAAVDQRLEPYDRDRVHGYRLSREACERILAELAALPLDARRRVPGLHPDRAPTIVAGGGILAETMEVFRLGAIEVSERDILEGAALEATSKNAQNAQKVD
jgi:exopolyphosphatase/guanosine-5'-triphosphate,3'-diphosphate pyrophosphatase